MVSLLTQNTKIKKSAKRTFNFGIPAGRSSTGLKTCPQAGACLAGCYARAGAYQFSNVARAFEERLKLTQSDGFVNLMLREIDVKRAERVRIHDSGDFYSAAYAHAWISIMHARPQVEFYAYTKQVLLFEKLAKQGDLPDNFHLIYSFGGLQDKYINTATRRHCRVFETAAELKAAGYHDVSENDDQVYASNHKLGIVYHGTKGYAKTAWDKAALQPKQNAT